MGISIRPWQKRDLASIRRITWQSWIATYSSFIPENDLRSYFDMNYTEASLLSMFDDPLMQGFIAEENDGEQSHRLQEISRPLKNVHLRRSPHPSSLRRTPKYASLLRISGALHLGIFDQPEENHLFSKC